MTLTQQQLASIKMPIIGWYARKRIGYLIIFLLLFYFFYFCFYKKQKPVIAIGCERNGCMASPCYGDQCNGDNCKGIGCHASDCYGEECVAGDCYGVGCKGGDCYGINCSVGKCIDPNCTNERQYQGLCKPNCSWGNAYNVPLSKYKFIQTLKRYMPQNTYFNRNICIKPNYITDKMVSNNDIDPNNNKLFNFNVIGATYYNGDYMSLNEIQTKTKQGTIIDDTKGLIRNINPIISTTPNIYKDESCNWCTTYDNTKICAKMINNVNFHNLNNVNTYNYNWTNSLNQLVVLDEKGKDIKCIPSNFKHNFNKNNIKFNLDIEQLKTILNLQQDSLSLSTIRNILFSLTTNKHVIFDKVEQIYGTEISCKCSDCNLIGKRTLIYDYFPTTIFGNIESCKERAYLYKKGMENYDVHSIIDKSKVWYDLIDIKIASQYSFSKSEKDVFINELHSLKNKHLMLYLSTDILNKIIIYECLFCSKQSYLYLDKLLTYIDNTNYVLHPCTSPSDYNHFIVQQMSSTTPTEHISYSCLKCNKSI